MPIECVCRTTIKASPAQCFAAFADPAGWTAWARDLDRVEILDPGGPGTPAQVRLVVTILGVEQDATVAVTARPEAQTVTFALVSSAGAKDITGAFRFAEQGSSTLMDADLRVVLIRERKPRVERMASRKVETALTRDFVRYVERAGKS